MSNTFTLPYRPMNGINGGPNESIDVIKCDSSVSRLVSATTDSLKTSDGVNCISLINAILAANGGSSISFSPVTTIDDSNELQMYYIQYMGIPASNANNNSDPDPDPNSDSD